MNTVDRSPLMWCYFHHYCSKWHWRIELLMTKKYQRLFFSHSYENSGFVAGLADFACLGWKRSALPGYPYEDENEALFGDWVTLGKDVESAKKRRENGVTR